MFIADKKFMWECVIPKIDISFKWAGVATKKGVPTRPVRAYTVVTRKTNIIEGVSEIYAPRPGFIFRSLVFPGYTHKKGGVYVNNTDPSETICVPINEIAYEWSIPPDAEYVHICVSHGTRVTDIAGNALSPADIINKRSIYFAGVNDMCYIIDANKMYAASAAFITGIVRCHGEWCI